MHIAIIMDGNGRWAQRRHLPRSAGHHAGARAVQRVVEAAAESGIDTLTLFAFSSDNWRRPDREVARLMRLFRQHLLSQTRKCVANRIRLSVIGRRDRLEPALLRAIDTAESATAGGDGMHLRIAVDYSGREAICRAALTGGADELDGAEGLARLMAEQNHTRPEDADVDLLIRTGGERRLSDFLLWECAYAELYFTDGMWPDFSAADLSAAVAEFDRRERRFGAVPDSLSSPAA